MVGRKLLIIFVLLAVVALGGLKFYFTANRQKPSQVPEPSQIIPVAEASQLASAGSPDGKLTLVMKTVKGEGSTTYSFLISGREIFEKTVDPSISFSIPKNTWSPDNKYLFLKEIGTTGVNYFVLSASKDSSLQNEQTANITGLFSKKYPDLIIEDVTGWGGINLVIVNSGKEDGSRGSSFWFDVPSGSFIQLSTHF